MKYFYVTALYTHSELPVILMTEHSLERYGYDGANIEYTAEFVTKESFPNYMGEKIMFLTEAEVELIKMVIAKTPWPKEANYVQGLHEGNWKILFHGYSFSDEIRYKNIEFKTIEIDF